MRLIVRFEPDALSEFLDQMSFVAPSPRRPTVNTFAAIAACLSLEDPHQKLPCTKRTAVPPVADCDSTGSQRFGSSSRNAAATLRPIHSPARRDKRVF